MNKKRSKTKNNAIRVIALLALLICVQCMLTIIFEGKEAANNQLFSSAVYANTEENTKEDPNEGEYIRLTDLEWRRESGAGYGSLIKNEASNGTKLSIKVEGSYYEFDYGIWAHATSNIYYDISEYSEKYHYLTMYVGINRTSNSGNGVKFWTYTCDADNFISSGTNNWELKNETISLPGQNATFVKIDIRGAKYLRLQAHDNGANGNDHSVYVNPMLITDNYEEENNNYSDISVYDQKIKDYQNKDLSDPNYEKLVLQRRFVGNVGGYALKRFIEEDPDNQATIDWLMNDVENLRYYILGGEPTGGYYNSLKVLTRLLKEYKSDFDIQDSISDLAISTLEKRHLNYPTTKGNLYKRMAITLSLTHSSQVGLWMQSGVSANQSDAVNRYKIYKDLYNDGKFKATDSVDMTAWFETFTIEEMRYVLNTLIDDEEILWLNEYVQTRIDAQPNNVWGLLTPHPYMAYVWPNYSNANFYSVENKEYFNDLFKTVTKDPKDPTKTITKGLFDYEITRAEAKEGGKYNLTRAGEELGEGSMPIYKLWMNFHNKFGTGAVCGGISKSGHCIRGVNAIPSAVIGQPGHAALLYYNRNGNAQGYWGIDNDVSGWTLSEKGERLPLGWGNDRSYRGTYNVPYVILAQEAINDMPNLIKAEELLMTVDTYKDDKEKQEAIYREAIEVQSINLDAWVGLINLYNSDNTKTEEQYYELAKEMMESLKCFPYTFRDLANKIKPKFTSNEYKFKYSLLETRILTEAKNYPNENSAVLQPSVTRLLASYILGQTDTRLASFSFDGADAGKIVLSSRFDGNGIRWDYSLDGKTTWNEVASTAENHKHALTKEEIASITAENDIYIHIVGTNYNEENIYKIDIQESAGLPNNLYANDLENKIIASVPGMEWKLNETDEWTSYQEAEPNLTGDKTVFVRMAATGTHLEGETVEYQFTQDEVNDKRKYVPIAHLEVTGYSTQSKDNKRPYYAENVVDGNVNTLWHTDFGQNVLQQTTKPFVTIKLDESKNISALEFTQRKYPGRPQDPDDIKNARVYVSVDGESWIQAGQIENCETYGDLYAINFEKAVYGQYVKIEMDTKNMFASLALVNLYEDTTVVTLGTFSFDGENAGKIMLLDEFKGTNWEYSLDGGTTWKTGAGDEQQLTAEELSQINADNKIKIRLKQGNKESTIDIQNQEIPVITAYLNDLENRLIGMGDTSKLEWRTQNSNGNWTSYSEQEAIVTGDTTLFIRKKATSTLLASEAVEFTFTEDNQPDTAKYVPIRHIASVNVSSTTEGRGEPGENAIDGLPTTMWHSNRTTTTMHDPRWIVLELDEPRYISKIEYVRKTGYGYGNPRDGVVSVSMDGENWTEVLNFQNLYNATTSAELIASDDRKELELSKLEQAKYVKIECTKSCDSVYGDRNGEPMDFFFSCAMINLFEDTTKIEKPTAEIEYSITETTNQDVTATLVNKNTEITVTNNDGKDTYTFTENGEFTFEFVNNKGIKGTATAKVDWIVKTLPTPSIHYTPDTLTNQDVTATVTFDREGTIIIDENGAPIENGNTHVFTENGSHDFRFKGPYGNIGRTTATVDWIDKKAPVATITYSSTNLSNQDVTATVTFDEENVTVKNGNTHTFTENGEYLFEFEDAAGNKGTAAANVTWIDKDLPTATIEYSTTNLTNQDVTATVTFTKNGAPLEGVTVEGGNTHVFEENGVHEFRFVGPAGNAGVAVAKVNWIDKVTPVGTIEYSNTNLTNQNVTATITFNKEDVQITNNGGKDTYTFEMNGEFEFEFVDKAGNKGTANAEVGWIDKREINATITYDINDITNQDVTASITFDKDNVSILNEEGEVIDTVTIGNAYTYTFKENGVHVFRFVGPAGNTGTEIAEVTWIDKIPPAATVSYSTTESTKESVTATVTFDEGGVTIVDEDGNKIENGDTYVFTENGTHTFYYVGPLGNKGTAVANVTWIDKTLPTAEIQYSTTEPTNGDVVAKLVNASEPITITNNNGSDTYTFTKNGEFTFEFVDKVGNKGTATANVTWIDKEIPIATITYSTTNPTNQNVTATITFDKEDVQITNNGGKDTYTFEKNGEFEFEFVNKVGSKGKAKANVTWIDKTLPTAEIEYSTTEPTNGEVIAKLVNASEEITITNNNGSDTYTFTENAEFTFEFVDAVGNKGTAIAKVDWIKDSPEDPDEPGKPEDPDEYKIGDVNQDGKITATDLLLVKRHLVSAKKQEWILTGEKFKAGDINQDGNITATDLLLIKRLVLSEMKK